MANSIILIVVGVLLVSSVLFSYDKYAARMGRWRIPELLLHTLELLGGVFVVVPLMYILHHKNKKFSYFIFTYLILLVWLIGVWFVFSYD